MVDLIPCSSIWRGPSVLMDVFVGEHGRCDGHVVGRTELYEPLTIIRSVAS